MTDRPFRASGVTAAALVAPLLTLFLAAPASAGLTYTGQFQRVQANGEGRTPIDFVAGEEAGPFAGVASVDFRDAAGRRSRARAAQESAFGDTFVRASGEVSARSEADVVVSFSALGVELRVTEPTPYKLDASLALTATGPAGPPDSLFTVFSVNIYQGYLLTRPGPLVVGQTVTESEFRSGAERPEFSAVGTLAPGAYVLRFSAEAYADGEVADGTVDAAEMRGSYTLDFRFGNDAGPGPGPGPQPGPAVPLPPAAWAGLLTLGGIVAAQWRAARRRA